MSSGKPSEPRLQAIIGMSPEQAAVHAACVTSLVDLLRPYVREAIRPCVLEALKRPTTREQVDEEIALVITAAGGRPFVEYVVKPALVIYLCGLRLWVGEKGKVLRHDAKSRDLIVADAAETATRQLVDDWLTVLCEKADIEGSALPLSDIDARMIPKSTFPMNAFSDPTGLDPEREVVSTALRKARATLPPGRKIPVAAERYLVEVERYEIRD
jgi:hypothetical protein